MLDGDLNELLTLAYKKCWHFFMDFPHLSVIK